MVAPIRILLLSLWLMGAAVHAVEDLPGSRDPAEVPRYPRSWIVDYGIQPEYVPREFVVSRVDRIRRDLLVENQLRPVAAAETVIYQIPQNVPLPDIVDHYRQQFGGEVLFGCSGRDCGRSNDWANQIFHKAILYGPDRNQHYLAVREGSRLLSLYVIERGNKRVYAHLQVLSLKEASAPEIQLAERLREQGWMIIENLQPRGDGSLPEEAAGVLAVIAPAIGEMTGASVYVVCHLAEGGAPADLLARSASCAERVATMLAGALAPPRVELRAFGAGPLLPRPGLPGNRVEIVLADREGETGNDAGRP